MLIPQNDRVLIQRIEEPTGTISLTDRSKSIKGLVLAVGPGKWIPGEWWWKNYDALPPYVTCDGEWEWLPGHREPLAVKPGMKVLFNSKWNDFAHAENKGTGADGKGALERPLSYKLDPLLHLVQEADIFAIVEHFDFTACLHEQRPAFMQNFSITEA